MSKVDLIIQSGGTILYPIVEEGISLSWDRKGSPGKLKFSVVKDSVLSFQEGDAVKLSVDGTEGSEESFPSGSGGTGVSGTGSSALS